MTHVYLHGKPIKGNELSLASELSAEDSEFLACAILTDKKHASLLDAILSKKLVNKISVAAYLNPFLKTDAKQEWLSAIQPKEKKLAHAVELLAKKMPKLATVSATENDLEKFHIAVSAIMQYLTTDTAMVKNAITFPGWVGILKLSCEKPNERSPWSLGWWLAEKGYEF